MPFIFQGVLGINGDLAIGDKVRVLRHPTRRWKCGQKVRTLEPAKT